MARHAKTFGLNLVVQLLASGLFLPSVLQAQQAAADAASVSPPVMETSHATAIVKLRDVAYGKDEDGNFQEPSARVREAAKEALKQEVAAQLREAGAAVPGANAPAARNPNSVTAADYSLAAPSGANTGDAIPTNPQHPSASHGSSSNEHWFLPDLSDGRAVNKQLNFDTGFSSMQPLQPLQPFSIGQIGAGLGEGPGIGPQLGGEGAIGSIVAEAVPGGPGNSVSTNSADAGAPNSVAGYLKSDSVQDVETQERSGISLDPHIRGYKWGQIYADADGAYWTPARLDMDTMLSKIDPSMVSNVNVLSGPYGVRYGPGFGFLDVNLAPTPRYADGTETHLDSAFNVHSNGGQVYGRETVYGGGCDWGFRGSFGDRLGGDYRAGDGTLIPGNYHAADEWGQLGYDIDPHQHLSFLYQRLDENNVDNPAEFFGTTYLGSYGLQAGYVNDSPTAPWSKLTAAGWFNATRFNGNTDQGYNPSFDSMQFVNDALNAQYMTTGNSLSGNTQGHAYSAGARAEVTFGDVGYTQLRAGGDYRYLGQVIGEQYDSASTGPFSTNMPHSQMIDPGAFAEIIQPVNKIWTLSVGARVDYVRTQANYDDLLSVTSNNLLAGGPNGTTATAADLPQNDVLYAFYATNKVKLDSHWTLDAGFGEAQRPPTLMERYSNGLFVSTFQSGFTHMLGDPELRPERDWQFDVGLTANYDGFHSKARFYQAFIQDYVTYDGEPVTVPPFMDARLVYFVNTRLATLTGFEWAGDYDWGARLTPFAKMSYVYGWDQEINAPLTGISPLEGTVGLRIHDSNHGKVWGIDTALRIVATQDLPGVIRSTDPPPTQIQVEEATPGFVVCNMRSYYNYSKNLSFVGGVDNLFNTTYQEHLDLRLAGPAGTPSAGQVLRVYEPGISPYLGINWTF